MEEDLKSAEKTLGFKKREYEIEEEYLALL